MNLAALLDAITPYTIHIRGDAAKIDVVDICYDSRVVASGSIFIALRGEHTDGHRFINEAKNRGACCIVCEDLPAGDHLADIVFVRVNDTKRCFSLLSATFFNHPSHRIPCIGITGTNGKSTVIHYLMQFLEAANIRTHYLSTVGKFEAGAFHKNVHHLTTPDAFTVQKFIAQAAGRADVVLIEATSHALSLKTCRLEDVKFVGAIITNITHEHLDFHKTYEQYTEDKLRLVNELLVGSPEKSEKKDSEHRQDNALLGGRHELDSDSPLLQKENHQLSIEPFIILQSGEQFEKKIKHVDGITRGHIQAMSSDHQPDQQAPSERGLSAQSHLSKGDYPEDVQHTVQYAVVDETIFSSLVDLHLGTQTMQVEASIAGLHNIKNAVMAMYGASRIAHQDITRFCATWRTLQNPIGRMQIIQPKDPLVVVDFAHSPDAFELFLKHMRIHTLGRLILVFGSAGERDKKKRSIQGKIAAAYADLIILCDEDPRGEASEAILDDIFQGVQQHIRWSEGKIKCTIIPNRKEAIIHAVSLSQKRDTLCTLGKGHETSVLYDAHEVEWDEIAVVKEALEQRKL